MNLTLGAPGSPHQEGRQGEGPRATRVLGGRGSFLSLPGIPVLYSLSEPFLEEAMGVGKKRRRGEGRRGREG